MGVKTVWWRKGGVRVALVLERLMRVLIDVSGGLCRGGQSLVGVSGLGVKWDKGQCMGGIDRGGMIGVYEENREEL